MAKPVAGHMVVANLDDVDGAHRLPRRGSLRRPPARPARRLASKAALACNLLEFFGQAWPV